MKKFALPIGKRFEEVLLPEDKILYDIHGNEAPVCADVAAAALEAIRNPFGTKRLCEIVQAGEKITIIISDKRSSCTFEILNSNT